MRCVPILIKSRESALTLSLEVQEKKLQSRTLFMYINKVKAKLHESLVNYQK